MGYFAAVLADNPVHFWELQDAVGSTTAVDAVASGPLALTVNGGTLAVGGPSSADVPNAWQGNGTSTGYLSVANDASFNITGSLTLECWVYPVNNSNYYWLVDKSQNGASGQPLPYEWRLENGTGKQYFAHNGCSTIYSNTAVPLNQWSHVAVTRTGTTISYYLNGSADGGGNIGGAPNASTNALVIGTRSGDRYSYAANGMRYAATALYNTALTQAQIQAHLNAMPGGNTRVTQLAAETLVAPTPATRVTQLAAETLITPTPATRITQLAAETLVSPTPSTRLTQSVVEVLVRNPKPSFIAYIID